VVWQTGSIVESAAIVSLYTVFGRPPQRNSAARIPRLASRPQSPAVSWADRGRPI